MNICHIFSLRISVYFQSFNFSVFSIFHFSVFSIFQFQCIFNLKDYHSQLGRDSHYRLRREYTFNFSVFSIFQFQCIFNLSISVYFQSFNFSVFSFFQFQCIFNLSFQCIFNLNYSNSRLGIPIPIKKRIYFNFQSIFSVYSILKIPTPA